MTSSTNFESYLPIYDAIPEKWDEAKPFAVEQFKKISEAVNAREIGYFLDEEVLTGQQFIPGVNNSQEFRSILRKVINFGPLPNTATKSVPHGIVFDVNFTLMHLYAAATDPVAFQAIPIPFAQPAGFNIQLLMDSTNVNITTTSNVSSYTRCYVVIEYIQEL